MSKTKGTPAHAARFLETLRATTRLEWTQSPAEVWTAPEADGSPAALILHVPGHGWLNVDEIGENTDLEAGCARRMEGFLFLTLEAAQAEALQCRFYEVAIRGAEDEGIPEGIMQDALEGRTAGNVVAFKRVVEE